MKKFLLWPAIVLGVALVIYNIWAYSYRATEKKSGWVNYPRAGRMRFGEYNVGKDSGKGNIIAIQPYVTPQNYSTGFNFLVTLRLYMEQIRRDSLIKKNTVVVFPEHIGTPLFACNEKESIYTKSNMKSVLNTMLYSNFFTWAPLYLSTDSVDKKMVYSILSMKSSRMAELYNNCFSSLAKEFDVTIIAGSIVLAEPYINDSGQLKSGKGSLYNVFAVYGPDGKVLPKLSEDLFLKQGNKELRNPEELKIVKYFETPAGSVILTGVSDSHRYFLFRSVDTASLEPDTRIRQHRVMSTLLDGRNIHIEFTGDMWEQSFDGFFVDAYVDTSVILGTASKRGRIINLWVE